MAVTSFGFALPLMLLVVLVGADNPSILVGADNPSIMGILCNVQKIPSGSPYFRSLGKVFEALVRKAYYNTSNDYVFRTSSAGVRGSPTAYGLSLCNYLMPSDHCAVCVEKLCNSIRATCPNAVGAQMQYGVPGLIYCSIEYEQYHF